MHTFLVIARKPGRDLPERVRDLLASDDVPDLWFEPESHLNWSSSSGNVQFAGWQAGSSLLGFGSYWHVVDAGLAAFTGRPFPVEGAWETRVPWAAQMSRRFAETPLTESRGDYRGIFALISLMSNGSGAIAPDPLGLGLTFWAESDDFAAFSNRAAVCARAISPEGNPPARDSVAAGWLAYYGYILGNATGFAGVRALPQGGWIELERGQGFKLREPKSAPWEFVSRGAAADPDELIELVRDDIAAALRAAVGVPGRHLADITGGKDSRLILALLLAEGLADEVEFETIGDRSVPDARVAMDTAERFGLKHRTHAALPLEPVSFEQQIKIHTFQTSGMLGASDLIGRSFPMGPIHISGACGEILRTNYPAYRDIRDSEHMLGAFRAGMHFDTLNLIKPERRVDYDRWAADALLALPWSVDDPLDLIDIFYLRQRLRRWLGAEQEMNFSNRVFPLYSLKGVRTAFAIGPSKRRAEFIPRELMQRYGRELLDMPLASGSWETESSGQTTPDSSRRAREQLEAERQKWQAQALRENKEVFRRLLPSDHDHPAFELFDRTAIAAAIDRAEALTLHGRIQLYGAMTAIVWLGRAELPWRMSLDGS